MTQLPKSEIEKLRNEITKQQENVNHTDLLKELEKYVFPTKLEEHSAKRYPRQ